MKILTRYKRGIILIIIFLSAIFSVSIIFGSTIEISHHELNITPYNAPIDYLYSGTTTYDSEDIRNNSLSVSIFGYSLQVEEEIPITRDLGGNISFSLQSFLQDTTYFNIQLDLAFGSYEFQSIPVDFEVYEGLENNRLYMYTLDNPLEGFFLNLAVYPSETYVSLAFDGGNQQLIYDGISNIGYLESNMILSRTATLYEMNTSVNSLNPAYNSDSDFLDYENELKETQLDKCYLVKPIDSQLIPRSADPYHIELGYGIVHNIADDVSLSYGDDIADKMALASSIDYTIYRDGPSESVVKSDLQYYNKEDLTYDRKIYAYHSFSHGKRSNAYWYWPGIFFPSKLQPSEVEALWGYSGGNFYYPSEMLLKATNCYGMHTLDMADAFIDYGANAYVGNTDYDYNLEPMDLDCDSSASHDGFWEALIDHGDTVSVARGDIISEFNYHNTWGKTWSTSNIIYEGSGSATIS